MIGLNTAWNFVNFRAGLIRALVEAGYEVVAVAPLDGYVERLEALGCRFVAMPMDNHGKHPGRELVLLLRLWRLLRHEQPDVYLGYTIKPNIYGSLAARALGIPVINNITGLGAVFSRGGLIASFVKGLYRVALKRSRKVFFQNDDDLELFVRAGLVAPAVTARLPGSGIDITLFSVVPLPNKETLRFLLIARLLWEKGVGEFVEAARRLKASGIRAEFDLLGFVDDNNPEAISGTQLEAWASEGVIRYLGVSNDVRIEIAQVDCVVLPSYYREGTPRTLLEAAAMGRPLITADSIGCRDVVEDGINGYLCRPRDAVDLATKLLAMINQRPEERSAMGLRGRAKIESEFDERIVIHNYLQAIAAIVDRRCTAKEER